MQNTAWKGFITGVWDKAIDVRDFIQRNYNPYVGDDSFLTAPTERTLKLWQEVLRLYDEEKKNGGVIDADTDIATSVSSHGPGYIIKELEQIVGLQTDKPLKRAMFPYGGLRTAKSALQEYGFEMDAQLEDFFKKHRKLTMTAFSMCTPRKCVPLVLHTSLPVYRMRTAAVVSSATIAV